MTDPFTPSGNRESAWATPPGQPALAVPAEPCGLVATRFDQAQGNRFRRSPSVLACIHRFEAAYQHSCDIEMKAREAIAAFRETERKWEKINGK